MGKTVSIATLSQENSDFSKYLDQCTANLMTSANADLTAFNSGTDSFYTKSNWDRQEIGNGLNKNYQQIDEFSLDIVTKMINAVSVGILGQSASPTTPKGSTLPEGTNINGAAIATVAAAIGGFEVLAAQAAVSIITNILGLFATKTTMNYSSSFARQSLAPGLTLHLFSFNAGFQQSGWFNNKTILESVFSYNIIYSFKEANMQQGVKYMQEHSALIDKLNTTQKAVQDKYDAAILSSDGSDESLTLINNMQKLLDMMTTQLNNYQTEMDNLTAKYNSGTIK
jgi:hypothetical protein